MREYSVRDEVGRAALIGDLLAVRIIVALAGMLVAIGFSTIAGYEDTLVLGTAIVSLSLVANGIQTTYATPLHATLKLGWITSSTWPDRL